MKILIGVLLGACLVYLSWAFLTGHAYEDEEELTKEELLEAYNEKVVPIKNYAEYLKGAYAGGTISEEEYANEIIKCNKQLDAFLKEYGLEGIENERN